MENDGNGGKRARQLIVVGASAGGIEALSALVATLPVEFPAPVVIAQHLSPHRASSLADILDRRSRLPVRTVNGHEPLESGVIYVVPPNRDVLITDHAVEVREENGVGPRPSVDLLFRSAAEVFGEELIAVILSGSGSDGAAGAREVKQAGGTVIVQNPETASFPGMPLSLAPSIVDIVANPDTIGQLLHDLLTGAFSVPAPTEDGVFRRFLEQLRDESGIDFTTYKQPTIMRRLQRRMAATGQPTLGEYVRFVRRHPEERQRLIASFLIKVTEFFRDPELFAYLREQVLPELMAAARQRGGELRLWSAGCATGEEAYSLAMIVAEFLGDAGDGLSVRIFATDLDSEAVGFARHGVYPGRALAAVPPAMVERYFTEHNGDFEVKKVLRSLVVFGEHDLGQRAPFPRIDLILCRNVLIYFTAALQRRALQLFAFSLRPGGYLALGKSETVNPLADFFAVDQSRLKVFRRVGERMLIPPGRNHESIATTPRQPIPPRISMPTPSMRAARAPNDPVRVRVGGRNDEVILGLPIGVVVVDRRYDIQSINATARRIFGIHSGALDQDFIHLIQHFPAAEFRRALDRAFGGETTTGTVVFEGSPPDTLLALEISTYPLVPDGEEGGEITFVTLVASDVTERERLRRAYEVAEATARRVSAGNEEVLAANLQLTNTIAKLRAENEELLVSTEEVQAATEEVETLNEELQASNEELETLNEELQATVEELNTTNDDLQARTVEMQELAVVGDATRVRLEAILASISDAVAAMDESGSVVLTNAAYDRMFGMPPGPVLEDEEGRPLPTDATPLRRASRGETFSLSFTITEDDGSRRWFEADGRAVHGEAGRLGVVTIRDITERSLRYLQDQWLGIASHELRTPLTALQAYLQLATRTMPPTETTRARAHLDRALAQARRIDILVSQLLEATRFQQGRLRLDRQPVDLRAVVRRAVETAEVLAAGRTIELDDQTTGANVIGDETRLEQVVLNLLTNAITHAPGSERIEVRLRPVGDEVELQVRDEGPGIPAAELPGIFDRFSQAAGIQSGGLGLGLFIAREIVMGHGGTIEVESTEGQGTTFTLQLPVAGRGAE
ncbi:MAG: two-component system, chemotaxis family, CheB/CheR fusion protein [Thermomicrobiales bacterium]|nr:two-component system, chemotaxis family, CheB/CheR fusion protein [Thermomicrobiales bacterium]